MNATAVWILFALGVVFLIDGAGLMIYGAVQKRAAAGVSLDVGIDKILREISRLFDTLARFVGPNRATRVGLLLIIVGLILIFLPVYLPTHA